MQILLSGSYWDGQEEAFAGMIGTAHRITRWHMEDGFEAFRQALSTTEVLVLSQDVAVDGRYSAYLREAPALRLLHLPFAGFDRLPPEHVPEQCQVCNVHVHSSAIAEYVLAGMLEMAIGLRTIDQSFRAGRWDYGGGVAMGIRHGELRGKRLGIFGYGHIGSDVARLAKAFGMTCGAVGSRARPELPEPLDWFGGPESFDCLLAESDYLVVAASLTEQTRNRFDAQALRRMQPSAVLINVGRGPIVDPGALYDALQSRRIRGAVLDVWYHYPTLDERHPAPSDLPFASLPNVVMTPHCSAWTSDQDARRIEVIARNIENLHAGRGLENVVLNAPPVCA